jgi:acyl carrier protein
MKMKREEVLKILTSIFQNNFDDEKIKLTDATSSVDIEDWDSLEQINLVVAVQDAFKIKFNIEEVNSMNNVGEMVDFIMKKVKG